MGSEGHVSRDTKLDPLARTFLEELHSVTHSPLPISMPKMESIKKAAMQANKHFKFVVYTIEKFISTCKAQYKLPAFHVIDAIVRQSVYLHGERDVYVARFSQNLTKTFEKAMSSSSHRDRQSLIKILKKWKSKGVFPSDTLKPLYKVASKLNSSKPSSQKSAQSKSVNTNSDNISSNSNSEHQTVRNKESKQDATEHIYANSLNPTITSNLETTTLLNGQSASQIVPPLMTQSNSKDYQQLSHDLQQSQFIPNHLFHNTFTTKLDSAKDETLTTNANIVAPPVVQDNIFASSSVMGYSPPKMIEISDRERRCLPPMKPGHLTVCSSTLWIGRLPRDVRIADISDVFGMFGAISSINMDTAMGCVYVCMDRRQDAYKIISERERIRLIKNRVNITWTPGEGFQKITKFKDLWDADIGASYIPYADIDESLDLEALEVGGVIDDESLAPAMRTKRQGNTKSRRSLEQNAPRSNLIPPPFLLQNQPAQQAINPFANIAYQALVNPNTTPIPSPLPTQAHSLQSQAQLAQLAALISFPNQAQIPQAFQPALSFADLPQLGPLQQTQGTLPAQHMLSNPFLNGPSILQNQHIPLNSSAQQVPAPGGPLPMEVIALLRTAQPQGQTKPYP